MRSRAGSQILEGKGFKEVYNLKGGIKAWQGEVAKGPEIHGLELFAHVKGLKDAAQLAYIMEEGLEILYKGLKERASSEEVIQHLERLAQYEVQHKGRIVEFYSKRTGESLMPPPKADGHVIEGAIQAKEIMKGLEHTLGSIHGILDAALMFEAQAMDLYFRLSKQEKDPEVAQFYSWLEDEEKGHILFVSSLLERY